MTSKIPSSLTGSQGQVLMPTGAKALEAFVSLILLPSAYLSTGADSALEQEEEDVALACWEPTFWFVRQEVQRGQNQRTGRDVL